MSFAVSWADLIERLQMAFKESWEQANTAG